MTSNATLGMTIQKIICDKYNLTPSSRAAKQFESAYSDTYKQAAENVIERIFSELKSKPIECLTLNSSSKAKESLIPHNFLLSNGSTLSIRTNLKGDKVAPRVVGQAGIKTFNEHFAEIAGYEIEEKNEIKKIIFEKIHLLLPTFIDYTFYSDYTIWIQTSADGSLTYTIFDKNNIVDINLDRNNFTFTRDLSEWKESSTLKYKGKSLAEIQIHTNRTFKFRFVMNSLSELIVDQKITTETLGITAEWVICDKFGLQVPEEYLNRYSVPISKEIYPAIIDAFKHLPSAIRSTGAEKGERGENSKCSYDFLLEGNKTLSVKTNTGKMICPPEVGQPGAKTCYLYFKDFIDGEEVTDLSFKEMVYNHIADIMPIYVEHLFDSDFLLWVYKRKDNFQFKIYDANFAKNAKWKSELFEFTKERIEAWNESNTVRYDGVSIGEFQVHKNRSSFKFRFNMENFEDLIKKNHFD